MFTGDARCGGSVIDRIGLGDAKSARLRHQRKRFGINPLRTIVCGDEYRDYAEALRAGLLALIAACRAARLINPRRPATTGGRHRLRGS